MRSPPAKLVHDALHHQHDEARYSSDVQDVRILGLDPQQYLRCIALALVLDSITRQNS